MTRPIGANYDKTATVTRLLPTTSTSDDANRINYQAHLSDLKCHLQQFTPNPAQDEQGSFSKSWLMFCDIVDIIEGDRVEIDGVTYEVHAVDTLEWRGRQPHLEVQLMTF